MAVFSPTNSRLLYGRRPFVLANGKDAAAIKVQLRDENNQPIVGGQVELVIESGQNVIVSQPELTDAAGNTVGYLTATSPGVVQIRARTLVASRATMLTETQLSSTEALAELTDSSLSSEWFARPITVTFFSRDIEVAPKLLQTERNIKITWSVSRQYYNDIDGIRVRITATEATLMPTKIFAYLLRPLKPGSMEVVGAFDHICSAVDLEEYPEDAPIPDERPGWFRLDYVDVLLRSKEEVREFINSVLEDVQILKNTLDVGDELLPAGEVWVGAPPPLVLFEKFVTQAGEFLVTKSNDNLGATRSI